MTALRRGGKAKSRPRAKPRPTPSRDARAVQRSLARLEASFGVARDRMTDVAVALDHVGRAAIDARLDEMARGIVADGIARDLSQARARLEAGEAFDAVDVRSLALLLRATLEWMERHVGLKAEHAAGDALDLRATALVRFDIEGDAAPPTGDVVSVRIDAPGWSRAGKVLAKPRATVVE